MIIYVTTLTGIKIVINVSPTDSIEYLKTLIYNANNTPVDQQRLIFNGTQLEDYRTLADYNIQQKATISMVLRLRGGMLHETSGRNGTYERLKSVYFSLDDEDDNEDDNEDDESDYI